MGRIDEELLHVGREGVEDQRPARGVPDHREERRLVTAEQLPHRPGSGVGAHRRGARLAQAATKVERDERRRRADDERNAPPPGAEFGVVEQGLQQQDDERGEKLSADQGHVLEGRVEAAPPLQRDLAHVSRRRAVLPPDRQPLKQPRQQQQRRSPGADAVVGRQASDDERTAAHHQHGDDHRRLASAAVGNAAEEPAADRPHQEPEGEDAGGVEQLRRGVGLRKKSGREVDRAERIDVEVEPLDEVARRRRDDREHTAAHVVRRRRAGSGGNAGGAHGMTRRGQGRRGEIPAPGQSRSKAAGALSRATPAVFREAGSARLANRVSPVFAMVAMTRMVRHGGQGGRRFVRGDDALGLESRRLGAGVGARGNATEGRHRNEEQLAE